MVSNISTKEIWRGHKECHMDPLKQQLHREKGPDGFSGKAMRKAHSYRTKETWLPLPSFTLCWIPGNIWKSHNFPKKIKLPQAVVRDEGEPGNQLPPPGRCPHGQATSCHLLESASRTKQPVTPDWKALPWPGNQLPLSRRCSHSRATSCQHPENAARTRQPVATTWKVGASSFHSSWSQAGPRCPEAPCGVQKEPAVRWRGAAREGRRQGMEGGRPPRAAPRL